MRKWAISVLVFVVGIWGTCFFLTEKAWRTQPVSTLQLYGMFGDSFGVVNALFSGLALLGVVIALCLQAHDAKKQREEFRLQAHIATCAAIIEAEKTLSEYYVQAEGMMAPPPIPRDTTITWADMAVHSRKRILDMSDALEVERKNLMAADKQPVDRGLSTKEQKDGRKIMEKTGAEWVKENQWHTEATYQSMITVGQGALKFTCVVNGGAIIAVMTFLGNVCARSVSVHCMQWPLGLFVAGLLFSAMATGSLYRTQYLIFNENNEEIDKDKDGKYKHQGWLLVTVILLFLSLAAFVIAAFIAVSNLQALTPDLVK